MRTIAAEYPPATTQPRSPWQSPMPYLFGGVAAMLSLIAFALLILACSYWRLSTRRDRADKGDGTEKVARVVYEDKILVIMAGHDQPTFLATPVCNRVSSFGHGNDHKTEETDKSDKLKTENEDRHE